MKMEKQSISVLIVDDSPESIAVLAGYLPEYKIRVALDGPDALEELESGTLPSLILLDVFMPGMDGFEVCKRVKRNPLTKDIPVIFISGTDEIIDKLEGFRLGAVDFITKPFQLEEAKSRIETHISLCLYRRELLNMNNMLEQKVQERTHELLVSKEKAEAAGRLKTHFLSLMSHELRTPMVGILGYSEVLIEEITEASLKEFALNLNESALRLKSTLEMIMNLTKLESATCMVTPAIFNLPDRVNELLKNHLLKASLKGLALLVVNRLSAPEVVLDQTMFDIILNNLVENAIKYTDQGTVTVELFDEVLEDQHFSCISVTDTGMGIPIEMHQIIFEEFRQVHKGATRNFEGVGLGLSLVKKYVEMQNGTVHLESAIGEGSKFTVRLKPGIPHEGELQNTGTPAVAKEKPQTSPSQKPKILVVEDDRINADITQLFLEEVVDLDIVKDAVSAVTLAGSNDYALILMDINLGRGLSGIEATKLIRQIDKHRETPIVAFTAFAEADDEKSFLSQGCTHYFPKPFTRDKLLALVNSVI